MSHPREASADSIDCLHIVLERAGRTTWRFGCKTRSFYSRANIYFRSRRQLLTQARLVVAVEAGTNPNMVIKALIRRLMRVSSTATPTRRELPRHRGLSLSHATRDSSQRRKYESHDLGNVVRMRGIWRTRISIGRSVRDSPESNPSFLPSRTSSSCPAETPYLPP